MSINVSIAQKRQQKRPSTSFGLSLQASMQRPYLGALITLCPTDSKNQSNIKKHSIKIIKPIFISLLQKSISPKKLTNWSILMHEKSTGSSWCKYFEAT